MANLYQLFESIEELLIFGKREWNRDTVTATVT